MKLHLVCSAFVVSAAACGSTTAPQTAPTVTATVTATPTATSTATVTVTVQPPTQPATPSPSGPLELTDAYIAWRKRNLTGDATDDTPRIIRATAMDGELNVLSDYRFPGWQWVICREDEPRRLNGYAIRQTPVLCRVRATRPRATTPQNNTTSAPPCRTFGDVL